MQEEVHMHNRIDSCLDERLNGLAIWQAQLHIVLPRCILLRMMCNLNSPDNKFLPTQIKDRILLQAGVDKLQQRLPQDWRVELLPVESQSQPGEHSPGPNTSRVRLSAPDKKWSDLLVAGRSHLEPRMVRFLADPAGAKVPQDPTLVVAPYLSRPTQMELRERGIGYVDLSGNIWLSVRKPGLYVEAIGATEEPNREDRPARTLKGQKAGGLFRVLIDRKTPPGVRALALEAGVDPGYVSRVLSLLEDEALVERTPRGTLERVDWEKLVRRWAQEMPFVKRGRLTTYLDPRGLAGLVDRLGATTTHYALTGSMAANQWAPIAGTRLLTIYTDDAAGFAGTLGLRPTETGTNVILVEPKDECVYRGSSLREGLCYVTPSQAVADLLTSPGRGPSEAEELIAWMRLNEGVWRA